MDDTVIQVSSIVEPVTPLSLYIYISKESPAFLTPIELYLKRDSSQAVTLPVLLLQISNDI